MVFKAFFVLMCQDKQKARLAAAAKAVAAEDSSGESGEDILVPFVTRRTRKASDDGTLCARCTICMYQSCYCVPRFLMLF